MGHPFRNPAYNGVYKEIVAPFLFDDFQLQVKNAAKLLASKYGDK